MFVHTHVDKQSASLEYVCVDFYKVDMAEDLEGLAKMHGALVN